MRIRQAAEFENSGYENYRVSLRNNAQTSTPQIFCKYCHGIPSL